MPENEKKIYSYIKNYNIKEMDCQYRYFSFFIGSFCEKIKPTGENNNKTDGSEIKPTGKRTGSETLPEG